MKEMKRELSASEQLMELRKVQDKKYKIETLTLLKFPNLSKNDLESISDLCSNSIEEGLLESDCFKSEYSYFKNLHLRSYQEINDLYNLSAEKIEKENSIELEKLERSRFHITKYDADFSFWLKIDLWTVEQAILLSLSKDPYKLNEGQLIANGSFDLRMGSGESEILKEYNKRFAIIESSIESGSLQTKPTYVKYPKSNNKKSEPLRFVKIFLEKEISIPEQIIEHFKLPSYRLLAQQNIDLIKEIEQYRSDKKLQEEKLEIISKENKHLNAKIDDLSKNKEASNEVPSKKEDPRIISSLYKIICGLVKKHYPISNQRISKIERNLISSSNIHMNTKCIREHVKIALEKDQSSED